MTIWIILGFLTNVYYFLQNHNEYNSRIKQDEITVKDLCVGFVLTLVAFPITIYNNEIKKSS